MFSPNQYGKMLGGLLQIAGFTLVSFIIGFVLGALIF
jgi:hypothetical protein